MVYIAFWPMGIMTIKFSIIGAIIGLIIGFVIIPYLFSCLIVWIYDNVKKYQRNKKF